MRILFSRVTNFLGRNGYFKCSGMNVILYKFERASEKGGPTVCLEPVTSRGKPGRCFMEIPIEEVGTLIRELQRALKEEAEA